MTLTLPQSMIDEMVAHAKHDLPNECCGVITGRVPTQSLLARIARRLVPFLVKDPSPRAEQLYRTRNAEPSPFRYSIDPRDLLKIERETDERGENILVIYHSHVASEAYPSPTDVRLSQWQGADPPMELYPGAYYVLVSLKHDPPAVRAFKIRASGEIEEQELVAK